MFKWLSTLPPSEKRITLSTALTLLRIALVPIIVFAMIVDWWGVACGLFIIAAVTDALDGALARWRNEQTFLGASLDPLADKLLIVSCFCTLAFIQAPLCGVPLWFVVLIMSKELLLIMGAWIIYLLKGRVEIRPTFLGKMTTLLQIFFIMWLFACYFCGWVPMRTYYVFLGIILSAVAISFVQYIGIGLQQVRK